MRFTWSPLSLPPPPWLLPSFVASAPIIDVNSGDVPRLSLGYPSTRRVRATRKWCNCSASRRTRMSPPSSAAPRGSSCSWPPLCRYVQMIVPQGANDKISHFPTVSLIHESTHLQQLIDPSCSYKNSIISILRLFGWLQISAVYIRLSAKYIKYVCMCVGTCGNATTRTYSIQNLPWHKTSMISDDTKREVEKTWKATPMKIGLLPLSIR